MLYIGCSGWSYPDWVGPFYPNKSTQKLQFYSRFFNSVEINTTFYRIPDSSLVSRWMERVSDSNFRFSVKFPRDVSHKHLMGDMEMALRIAEDFEREYLIPMKNKNRLAAVLIQLPPYFTIKNSHRLMNLMESLSTSLIRYFIEPRHSTLYGNEEFQRIIFEAGADIVDIDGPEFEFSDIHARKESFYLRLHGRNYSEWNRKTDDPSARYDYEYSGEMLESFSEKIRQKLKRYADAFIYFNNHPNGQAARNAIKLSTLLDIVKKDPQNRLM